MATKKQKREAAAAKRAAFMEEQRETGLAAQKLDKTIRQKQQEQSLAQARDINARLAATLTNQIKAMSRKFSQDLHNATGDEEQELHQWKQWQKFHDELSPEMRVVAENAFHSWAIDNQ